jgi:hypothetical protein
MTGYWSSGTRLADSGQIDGRGLEYNDFPEYMVRPLTPATYSLSHQTQCGGAQTRTRPTSLRRRKRRTTTAGPSNQTGAQTIKKRKAGARIAAAGLFVGDGKALNADANEETKKRETVFRKRAVRSAMNEDCLVLFLYFPGHGP